MKNNFLLDFFTSPFNDFSVDGKQNFCITFGARKIKVFGQASLQKTGKVTKHT
jgi:hypothetical protein